jgi:hypothetical protein
VNFKSSFSSVTISLAVLCGCQQGSTSDFMSLGADQKPEGFLLASDITEDKTKAGSFVVNCVMPDGKKIAETKSKDEIAKNNFCKPAVVPPAGEKPPVVAAGGLPKEPPKTEDLKSDVGPQSLPFDKSAVVIRLITSVAKESFLKRDASIDVTRDRANLIDGADFCVVPAAFGVDSVCRFSSTHLRITGHTLKSCATMSDKAFIYEKHFTLAPATVSACK